MGAAASCDLPALPPRKALREPRSCYAAVQSVRSNIAQYRAQAGRLPPRRAGRSGCSQLNVCEERTWTACSLNVYLHIIVVKHIRMYCHAIRCISRFLNA